MADGSGEHAGNLGAATAAAAIAGDAVGSELVPVAFDEERPAGVAVGRLPISVGHVARVSVGGPRRVPDAGLADPARVDDAARHVAS